MSKKVLYIILSMGILLIACDGEQNPLSTETAEPASTADYILVFTSTWSHTTHPVDFPANPHFSGLVGATHNSAAVFWEEGQLASKGIKDMAERGLKDPLIAEVDSAIQENIAGRVLSGGGLASSPDSVMLGFTISKEYPLVTVVVMLAPSPDWFIGVSGLSLMENNQWMDIITVPLYTYDAGTDNGITYAAPDEVTIPPDPIAKIEVVPFLVDNTLPMIGTFTITRQHE